jgi:uncharacterized membrane protein (DUF485 family)
MLVARPLLVSSEVDGPLCQSMIAAREEDPMHPDERGVESERPPSERPPSERPLESRATGSLLAQLFRDGSDLVKKEMELARAEVRSEIKGVMAKTIGMAAAALCALIGVSLLCAAAVLGLAQRMAGWQAALLVAVFMFVIAWLVMLTARRRADHKPFERTQRTLKEDVRWAREQTA